jgi:ubiquinone/menaquinone biosynthesis C-methylase UbiE
LPAADVPSPIDLRDPKDAARWAASAMVKRPWRAEFFARIAGEVARLPRRNILELGSGPGFLAEAILRSVTDVRYTLLDFSQAMHELAAERLGSVGQTARFVCADFRDAQWTRALARFDAVVTLQRAGFERVSELMQQGGLVLHRAEPRAAGVGYS